MAVGMAVGVQGPQEEVRSVLCTRPGSSSAVSSVT